MKYYIYASKAKVDMLYSQIPVPIRSRIASEIKLDFKLLSATFSEDPQESTLYRRLDVVVSYIEEHEPLGTVGQPATFFRESLPLRWGLGLGGALELLRLNSELVYFGSVTSTTILGLGGSRKHLVGEDEGVPFELPYRYRPGGRVTSTTMRVVLREMMSARSYRDENVDRFAEDPLVFQRVAGIGSEAATWAEREFINVMAKAAKTLTGPEENLEVIARRIAEGSTDDGMRVLVGTPIYVAHAD